MVGERAWNVVLFYLLAIPLPSSDTLAFNCVSLRQHSLCFNSYICIALDVTA